MYISWGELASPLFCAVVEGVRDDKSAATLGRNETVTWTFAHGNAISCPFFFSSCAFCHKRLLLIHLDKGSVLLAQNKCLQAKLAAEWQDLLVEGLCLMY